MSRLPSSARVVVIGAGIVGNSLACHLARLGWTEIVQLDKGPLPNPGGSTGHASNFIFPVDHSREMTALTLDSVRQYKELDVFTRSGGIEVARTEERMEELRRRMASAKAWGVEGVRLVTPAEIKELVPFIDESVIVGGFYTEGVGVVDSLRAGTLMREEAQQSGALDGGSECRGHRDRRRARARPPRPHHRRRRRGRHRRDRLRRLEPAAGGDGGRHDPAHARDPPDDRHRAGAAVRGRQAARSSSRSCATWTRTCTSARTAPAWRSAPTRTGRSCTTRRRSPRSRNRRCPRPSSRSPRTTSRCRWSRRSS